MRTKWYEIKLVKVYDNFQRILDHVITLYLSVSEYNDIEVLILTAFSNFYHLLSIFVLYHID